MISTPCKCRMPASTARSPHSCVILNLSTPKGASVDFSWRYAIYYCTVLFHNKCQGTKAYLLDGSTCGMKRGLEREMLRNAAWIGDVGASICGKMSKNSLAVHRQRNAHLTQPQQLTRCTEASHQHHEGRMMFSLRIWHGRVSLCICCPSDHGEDKEYNSLRTSYSTKMGLGSRTSRCRVL